MAFARVALSGLLALLVTLASAGPAKASGTLRVYNWESYTSAPMIEQFEKAYGVEVILLDYTTSDGALASIRDGTVEADLVVVAGNYLPRWRALGLLQEAHPTQLPNFRHVMRNWADPPFDPGRRYSVPWAWGIVGVAVHTDRYGGDIDTWSVVLDPPPELAGTINVGADMNELIYAAIRYHGGKMCDADDSLLDRVQATLARARPDWAAMEYGSVKMMASGRFQASIDWNGAALRQRQINPNIRFGFPREGTQIFSDNLVLLKNARNPENARLFMDFIMAPRNAALNSSFHGYASAIEGAQAFMPQAMRTAPELNIPAQVLRDAEFTYACPDTVQARYASIWEDLAP